MNLQKLVTGLLAAIFFISSSGTVPLYLLSYLQRF